MTPDCGEPTQVQLLAGEHAPGPLDRPTQAHMPQLLTSGGRCFTSW